MEFLYRKFIKNYHNTKDSKVIKRYGIFAGIIGIIFNTILFLIKIVIALMSGSVSIISDAINNLSDASSSVITLIGFKLSSKPADKKHPFGHQRIEYICAFVISFIILLIGLELGISSVKKIINPVEFSYDYIILIILFMTIFIKLWIAIFYYKTSKKINSLSLKASFKDSINDVITTLIIVIGLLIGKIFNFNIDGYLGLLVCIYIVVGGINLVKETVDKLIGGTPDKELINQVKIEVLKDKNILGIHDILYHYYGGREVYMSLHAEIDSSLSLVEAHEIIDKLEKNIKKMYQVELVIHIDPIPLNDELLNDINLKLTMIIENIDKNLNFHELKITNKKNKIIISFDLEVPYDYKLSNEEIYLLINSELNKIDSNYRASINFDKN